MYMTFTLNDEETRCKEIFLVLVFQSMMWLIFRDGFRILKNNQRSTQQFDWMTCISTRTLVKVKSETIREQKPASPAGGQFVSADRRCYRIQHVSYLCPNSEIANGYRAVSKSICNLLAWRGLCTSLPLAVWYIALYWEQCNEHHLSFTLQCSVISRRAHVGVPLQCSINTKTFFRVLFPLTHLT